MWERHRSSYSVTVAIQLSVGPSRVDVLEGREKFQALDLVHFRSLFFFPFFLPGKQRPKWAPCR